MKYKTEKLMEDFSNLFNQEISGTFTTSRIKDMTLEDFAKYQKAAKLIEDAKELSVEQAEQIDRLEEKMDKILKRVDRILWKLDTLEELQVKRSTEE